MSDKAISDALDKELASEVQGKPAPDVVIWLRDWVRRIALMRDAAMAQAVLRKAWMKAGRPYPMGVLRQEFREARGAQPTTRVDAAPKQRPFELGDHTELGHRLLEIVDAESGVAAVYDRGDLYAYNGTLGVWSAFPSNKAMHIIDEFSGSLVVKSRADDGSVQYGPLKMTDTATRGAWSAAKRSRMRPGFFDGAPAGIAFVDGFLVVDETGEDALLDHSPENRATIAAPVKWAGRSSGGLWDAFLERLWAGQPDADARKTIVLEFAGLALLGLIPRYERCLILHGSKAGNGKSTLLRILSALFHESNRSAIPPQQFAIDTYLASMANSRWNCVNELPRKSILDSERFNAVISGNPIQVKPLYRDPFMLSPRAAHVFACNELPGTIPDNEGFWRRVVVVEFPNVFREGQPGFDAKLADKIIERELAAVYHACIGAACQAVRRGKLTIPQSAGEAVEEWRAETDTVRQWLHERCSEVAGSQKSSASEVWRDYQQWGREAGLKNPLSQRSFWKRLHGLELGHKGTGGAREFRVALRAPLAQAPLWGQSRSHYVT